jgi:hypothetical protein
MLSVALTAGLAGVPERMVYRWLEKGNVHFLELPDGADSDLRGITPGPKWHLDTKSGRQRLVRNNAAVCNGTGLISVIIGSENGTDFTAKAIENCRLTARVALNGQLVYAVILVRTAVNATPMVAATEDMPPGW